MFRTGASILALMLLFSPLVRAQEVLRPTPALPWETPSPQLVAWSELQKPRPAPQPLPAPQPDPPSQPPGQQPVPTQPQQPADSQNRAAAHIFTGTVVSDGRQCALKLADGAVYELDDPARAQRYEGKEVRISGSLDPATQILHVISIEPLS